MCLFMTCFELLIFMSVFVKRYDFVFFKQKTAYERGVRLVGSEICIRHIAKAAMDAEKYLKSRKL